jgi:hypothetical protein
MTTPDLARWIDSGLTDRRGTGVIERVLDGFGLLLPKDVWVDGEDVCWSWGPANGDPIAGAGWTKPGEGLLEDFVGLAGAAPEDVALYVRRWGPLLLCSCGRPAEHPVVSPRSRPAETSRCEPCYGTAIVDASDHHTEPLRWWDIYARRARGVLRLVVSEGMDAEAWADILDVCDGSPLLELSAHEWKLHGGPCSDGTAVLPQKYSNLCDAEAHEVCRDCGFYRCFVGGLGWAEVGRVVDEWLQMAGVRARFLWLEPKRPQVFFGRNEGLLGEIALQLALASARSDAIAMCTSCARPFIPRRRVGSGRNAYCSACGLKAARRDALRRYRERQRTVHTKR